ncbi:hypothetical protein L3Q65_24325 [Amycolatopsis sp. FU40]|uniref:hypothetical protein n=1 Tax=Amycolatopsis sp. FU40 TaxID=2914159 RepID=UPI001F28A97A|nr:hypothetical protein [Amycolatopsis sp. FU40]UKD51058.1 hypothetical protein L3Q65_24325 [Amycolatopsis sp. FU40]
MSKTERPPAVAPVANPSAKGPRRWLLVALLLVAIAVIAAAVYALASPTAKAPSGLTVQGSITIDAPPTGNRTPTFRVLPGGKCQGSGGYADLAPGAIVQVSDGTGHILGTSSLDHGSQESIDGVSRCKMVFIIQDVAVADRYVLQIANRNRIVETLEQIRAGVDLTIGRN